MHPENLEQYAKIAGILVPLVLALIGAINGPNRRIRALREQSEILRSLPEGSPLRVHLEAHMLLQLEDIQGSPQSR